MGLQLQTILNAEDSPSRNGVPDTPSSARYPSGVSSIQHQVRVSRPCQNQLILFVAAKRPPLA